jgi:DNA-binding transcriptional ArsR family regulator
MTPGSNAQRKPAQRRRDDATKMAKALSHPLRAAMVVELNHRVASPVDLARVFDQPLGKVSYHVRTLLDLDIIELVETKPRRGAVEHFYRATHRAWAGEGTWEDMPTPGRRALALQWFRRAFADASQAIDDGKFTTEDVHFSITSIELDDDGWAEIDQAMQEVIERAFELQAQAISADASRRTGRLVTALFEPAKRRRARSSKASA